MARVKVTDPLALVPSVAVTVTGAVPVAPVSVPEMTPVVGLMVSPAGRPAAE